MFHSGADEANLRVVRDIEEIGRTQVGVAVRHPGAERVDIDGGLAF